MHAPAEARPDAGTDGFAPTLARHGLRLTRARTTTLQINVGRLCNQLCRHCHLDAGPERRELMDHRIMAAVIAFARRHRFALIDITGGAPELHPELPYLLRQLAGLADQTILRSNLTAMHERRELHLAELCRDLKIAITASLPSTERGQTTAMRGQGVFETSLAMLKQLNLLGYGQEGAGLELNLVANPAGAFLPPAQCQTEKQFKRALAERHGISFNRLFSFANAPLGRYRQWLLASGNHDAYMRRLRDSFNPETISGLMCRSLISVADDGVLYDCDFNIAAGLPHPGRRTIEEIDAPPAPGAPIATGDHCFACTAGSGFT